MTNAVTCVEDLFDSLDKEKPEKVRRPIIFENRPVSQMMQGLEKLIEIIDKKQADLIPEDRPPWESYCSGVCKGMITEVITSSAIQQFLFESQRYETHEGFTGFLGAYVSNLITRSPEQVMRLDLSHFDTTIDFVGYKVRDKHIHVIGDLGNDAFFGIKNCTVVIEGDTECGVAQSARNSSITIHGSATYEAGNSLKYGTVLHITGNAGDWLGETMQGGVIRVDGDVGRDVGRFMRGGTIYLNGTVGDISNKIHGGDIYYRGRQVVKDGKRLE